jgi:hypothetical protein
MVGGQFQASNEPTFSTGVAILYTIQSVPQDGYLPLTQIQVYPAAGYRYVRYIGPANSYCDIAEAQFYGYPPVSAPLTGAVIGTSGPYQNDGNVAAKAVDGNLNTFFDGPSANGNYVGLNFGDADVVTQISYAPRSGWASRMVGGIFQGSDSPTFSSGVANLYTITATPKTGALTTVSLPAGQAFEYARYLSPANSFGDVAEIQFSGYTPPQPLQLQEYAAAIGTAGSYHNQGNTIANAFDGNLSTYFDGPDATGDWVGLTTFGTPTVVTQVAFAPRAGLQSRMVGGEIQASDSADFSSGVVTLFTITTSPAVGCIDCAADIKCQRLPVSRFVEGIPPRVELCECHG